MLEFGGLLLAGSILLLSILIPIFRRPNPPRWTGWPLVAELITVGITATLAFGGAFLIVGVTDFVRHGVSFMHLGLLLAVIIGVILFGRWLSARVAAKAP